MLQNIFPYLKYESQLIDKALDLAEKQLEALKKFDADAVEHIARYQEELSASLRQAEEKRMRMLTVALKISRKAAAEMKLSALEGFFNPEEVAELRKIKKELKTKLAKLAEINSTNRILANRARSSARHMLSLFSDGKNRVCNVKV